MTKSIICKDVFGNQYTVPVDELNIRVGVYAVIIEDNKILLTRQWDGYSLIGGGVEKGETIEESIIREVKEETGLVIMPDKIIHQATTFLSATLRRKLISRFSCTSRIASCTGKSITTT
ncbi:MAG: NUDIX domain-containing protein [Candidatus Saccharimonas sp.]|nr:MAG: NUDIX domain-containing protein [Candidatus Saccharimonas sp.]